MKKKKEKDKKLIKFSKIYGSLNLFKNKIIKNIHSRKIRQSPNSTNCKRNCVSSIQQQQHKEHLLLQKEQKPLKFIRRNDVNKYTDISKELDNSADTSFTSNASAQADITICSQQKDGKKSHNYNCFTSQNITKKFSPLNEQISPLSMINDDQSVIYSNRFTDKLSKNSTKQTFLKNKITYRYLCGEQCPYALYKLCNKYRCSTPEKKVNDEINGLTLEYPSFEKKKDFQKFINVDTVRNDECFMEYSPVEIRINESSTSSLSVNLEVDVCNDSSELEDVDEFTERRKARTYIINRTSMKKDDLIKDCRTENELPFNIISSQRKMSEKRNKIDEIVKVS